MHPREQIIHAVLVKTAAGEKFDFGKLMDNPAVGYGVLGAGVGGGLSLLKSILGGRSDSNSSALQRLLGAMAVGGMTGAAAGGGAQLLGFKPTPVRQLAATTTGRSTSGGDPATSIGVGMAGAGGIGGAAITREAMARRQALTEVLGSGNHMRQLSGMFEKAKKAKPSQAPSPQDAVRGQLSPILDRIQRMTNRRGAQAGRDLLDREIANASRLDSGVDQSLVTALRKIRAGNPELVAQRLPAWVKAMTRPKSLLLTGLGLGTGHYLMSRN